jgi:electron transfer flavoprotein beta subunit
VLGFAGLQVDASRSASMKLVVCVKQVAVLGDEVEFTDDERGVDPDYLDHALNEWDTFATEEALRLREAAGEGEVVVVSVGDEDAEEALRRCLAMGADRAVQAATGTVLAELLELPRVAVVTKVELADGKATVHRELEGGLVDVVEVDTPALLTIQTGINEPRYATLRAIKQAEEKEIEVREAGDVGAPVYRVRRMFVPPKGEGAEMLNGGAGEVAQRIKEIVEERLK